MEICERCETRDAAVKISATDLQGVVLDGATVCRPCARDAGFEVGKDPSAPKPLREKVIGDTLYTFTRFFRRGAHAFWNSTPYNCCPYKPGSQRADDWEDGHTLASGKLVTRAEIGS